MNDEQGFRRAIAANPDDDLPKMVFSDWLEEQGRNEEAEAIRYGMQPLNRLLDVVRRRKFNDAVLEALTEHLKGRNKVNYKRALARYDRAIAWSHGPEFKSKRYGRWENVALWRRWIWQKVKFYFGRSWKAPKDYAAFRE